MYPTPTHARKLVAGALNEARSIIHRTLLPRGGRASRHQVAHTRTRTQTYSSGFLFMALWYRKKYLEQNGHGDGNGNSDGDVVQCWWSGCNVPWLAAMK